MPEFAGQARAKLAGLEEARMAWVPTGMVNDGSPGKTDKNYQVVESDVDGKLVRQQLELREDPTAPFVRPGLATLKKLDPEPVDPESLAAGVKDA